MAIYSFNHDTFGRTTAKPGAAAQNAAYNSRENATRLPGQNAPSAASNAAYNAREEATYAVRSHIIPPAPDAAEAWFKAEERGERKNARMSDRFIGALPRELTPDQCIAAVESFCRGVTQDRVPWHFALHLELEKKAEADWNPHAHIIIRDRDIETGKRVLYTSAGPKERKQLSEQGVAYWTTKDFREAWGKEMNLALERAGHEARIDHRTLAEQGVNRTPQIHIGPASKAAAEKGFDFKSKDQTLGERVIAYSRIDEGTRAEHNASIIEANRQRGSTAAYEQPAHQPDPRQVQEVRELHQKQRETRAAVFAEQRLDHKALNEAQTLERKEHQAWGRQIYAAARETAYLEVKAHFAEHRKDVRQIEDRDQRLQASAALKLEQKAAYATLSVHHIDLARPVKDEAYKSMVAAHGLERQALKDQQTQETAALARQHAAERLAIAEKWRGHHLERQASLISVRLDSRHGMAPVQSAAIALQKLHSQAGAAQTAEGTTLRPGNPQEAAKRHMQQSREDLAVRKGLRHALTENRSVNEARAAKLQRQPGIAAPHAKRDRSVHSALKERGREAPGDRQNGHKSQPVHGRNGGQSGGRSGR